jgi:hypothetical protein
MNRFNAAVIPEIVNVEVMAFAVATTAAAAAATAAAAAAAAVKSLFNKLLQAVELACMTTAAAPLLLPCLQAC